MITPPDDFFRGVRDLCDETGALMIVDEVQTGMGRTGRWLGIQHTGVEPDMVTLAKGIASGFPMGALAAREGLEFTRGQHGSTFAGGPLACAAAHATIDVIEEVLPSVAGKGERFRAALAAYAPRVRGLMVGITLGDSLRRRRERLRRRGRPRQLRRGRQPPARAAARDHRRRDRPGLRGPA